MICFKQPCKVTASGAGSASRGATTSEMMKKSQDPAAGKGRNDIFPSVATLDEANEADSARALQLPRDSHSMSRGYLRQVGPTPY